MPGDLVTHQVLTDDLREQAALYSMGLLESVLEPEAAARWERHLEICAVCAEEVGACVAIGAALGAQEAGRVMATLPADEPPARVKENLLRQVTPIIRRAAEGRWHPLLPGIEIRRLFVDPVTRSVTSLVRVAEGAVYPAHLHKGTEHLYVLDGEIVFDDHTLSTGDYEVRLAHSSHSSSTTAPGEGCLLLVINSGQDEFL